MATPVALLAQAKEPSATKDDPIASVPFSDNTTHREEERAPHLRFLAGRAVEQLRDGSFPVRPPHPVMGVAEVGPSHEIRNLSHDDVVGLPEGLDGYVRIPQHGLHLLLREVREPRQVHHFLTKAATGQSFQKDSPFYGSFGSPYIKRCAR